MRVLRTSTPNPAASTARARARSGYAASGVVAVATVDPDRVVTLDVTSGLWLVSAAYDLTSSDETIGATGIEVRVVGIQLDSDVEAASRRCHVPLTGAPSALVSGWLQESVSALLRVAQGPISARLPLTSSPTWSGTCRLYAIRQGDF